MHGFWDEMDRLGKDRNPYRAGFLQFVGVGESRQHAMDLYGEAAEYFYGRCLHIDPRFATPPGYVSEATQRAGIEGQMAQAANNRARSNPAVGSTTRTRFEMVARDMEHIVENGYVIIGSPDEVTEQLREVATDLNVGHLMLLLAVRQPEQGSDALQHEAVRRARAAEHAGPVRRMGGPLVAAADGAREPGCCCRPSSPKRSRRNSRR